MPPGCIPTNRKKKVCWKDKLEAAQIPSNTADLFEQGGNAVWLEILRGKKKNNKGNRTICKGSLILFSLDFAFCGSWEGESYSSLQKLSEGLPFQFPRHEEAPEWALRGPAACSLHPSGRVRYYIRWNCTAVLKSDWGAGEVRGGRERGGALLAALRLPGWGWSAGWYN